MASMCVCACVCACVYVCVYVCSASQSEQRWTHTDLHTDKQAGSTNRDRACDFADQHQRAQCTMQMGRTLCVCVFVCMSHLVHFVCVRVCVCV